VKRTIRPVLRLAVTVIGALWCEVQQAQSQDHVFANPPMLSTRDGRLDVDLVASPGTYTIDGHQFQGMLYNGAYIPPVWRVRLGDSLTSPCTTGFPNRRTCTSMGSAFPRKAGSTHNVHKFAPMGHTQNGFALAKAA
jgi:hypothetical protein